MLEAGSLPRPPGSRSTRRVAAVFLLALAVRLVFLATILPTGCLAINADPVSDMSAFHQWAVRISEGDVLGREEFHPFHPWQRGIADEKTWLKWYGPRVFHQDPLYPYFVAAVYALARPEPLSVLLLQLLLGAAAAAAIALLAERLAGPRAGLAAGVLAALYAPFIFYESLLLRDTLLVLLATTLHLAIEEARRRPGLIWWSLTGLVAGAIYLAKPNVIVFMPFLAAWLLLGREVSRPGAAVAGVAIGFILALSPAVARNVAVGAPPFKTTTRGAIEFINGNNPYHVGTGWFDGEDPRVTGYARSVMAATKGRLLPTIAHVMSGWRGDPGGWLLLQIRKLGYLLAPFEMPNNASFAYFRLSSPVLAAGLPTFFVISPLAAVGLLSKRRSWRRFLPHYLFVATGIAVTVAFYVIARFRTPFLPMAIVLAGAGAGHLIDLAARRRGGALLAWLGVAGGVLAVNVAANIPDRMLVRPQDYAVSARDLSRRGMGARAVSELEAGVEIFAGSFPLRVELARAREEEGDLSGALEAWREAQAAEPRAPGVAEEIARLLRALGEDLEESAPGS
jgi:4-amino-4-deoxy-L-arabinose transferase-like glycosyltransferase